MNEQRIDYGLDSITTTKKLSSELSLGGGKYRRKINNAVKDRFPHHINLSKYTFLE